MPVNPGNLDRDFCSYRCSRGATLRVEVWRRSPRAQVVWKGQKMADFVEICCAQEGQHREQEYRPPKTDKDVLAVPTPWRGAREAAVGRRYGLKTHYVARTFWREFFSRIFDLQEFCRFLGREQVGQFERRNPRRREQGSPGRDGPAARSEESGARTVDGC